MESNVKEHACTDILQEEDDEEPCDGEYQIAHDHAVDNVGG